MILVVLFLGDDHTNPYIKHALKISISCLDKSQNYFLNATAPVRSKSSPWSVILTAPLSTRASTGFFWSSRRSFICPACTTFSSLRGFFIATFFSLPISFGFISIHLLIYAAIIPGSACLTALRILSEPTLPIFSAV